jgi:hypothetical protein
MSKNQIAFHTFTCRTNLRSAIQPSEGVTRDLASIEPTRPHSFMAEPSGITVKHKLCFVRPRRCLV